MLTEVARHAADGRPQVVVIESEVGVGKSSLVRAAIDDLDSFTVLRADADELATGASMWLVAQLDELDSRTPLGAGQELLAPEYGCAPASSDGGTGPARTHPAHRARCCRPQRRHAAPAPRSLSQSVTDRVQSLPDHARHDSQDSTNSMNAGNIRTTADVQDGEAGRADLSL